MSIYVIIYFPSIYPKYQLAPHIRLYIRYALGCSAFVVVSCLCTDSPRFFLLVHLGWAYYCIFPVAKLNFVNINSVTIMYLMVTDQHTINRISSHQNTYDVTMLYNIHGYGVLMQCHAVVISFLNGSFTGTGACDSPCLGGEIRSNMHKPTGKWTTTKQSKSWTVRIIIVMYCLLL